MLAMKTKGYIAIIVIVSTIAVVSLFGHFGFSDYSWFGGQHNRGGHHVNSSYQMNNY